MGVVVAMGVALSTGILRSVELAEELRESRQRMKLAAAAARMAHWHWDAVADELWITREGRELYGLPVGEMVTMQRLRRTIHHDERAQVEEAMRRSNGAGEFHTDYRVVLPGGSVRWIREQAAVEADTGGRVRRVRGVSFDITRAREAELEVQAQREELAHLSRVATLGESSGSLAHELNQPLMAILSNAEAALRFLKKPEIDRAELTEILQDIVAADERAGLVIRRLRLLFGKGKAQLEPLDVDEVVADVLKIMHGELLTRSVRVAQELEPDLRPVMGDRVQLQQVLLNLITNAIDAMIEKPESERRLWVRTEGINGAAVRVSVRDSGHGLEDEERTRIFEPFFTTKKHGLGLGLAVCRTILAAHGSELHAENHREGGASFHFTLPIAMRESA